MNIVLDILSYVTIMIAMISFIVMCIESELFRYTVGFTSLMLALIASILHLTR